MLSAPLELLQGSLHACRVFIHHILTPRVVSLITIEITLQWLLPLVSYPIFLVVMVLRMQVALRIDTLGVVMVTQLPSIPRTDRARVEHKLLSFGHFLHSVLIRRVLFLVCPCVSHGHSNWLDGLALGCAWVVDFLDCEGNGLSLT